MTETNANTSSQFSIDSEFSNADALIGDDVDEDNEDEENNSDP